MPNKDIFRIVATDAAGIGDAGWVSGKHFFSTDNKEHVANIEGSEFRYVDKLKILLRDGTQTMTGNLDLDGNSLIIDTDADSNFNNPADDVLALNLGGAEKFRWTTTGFGSGFTAPIGRIHTAKGTTTNPHYFDCYSTTDANSSNLVFRKSNNNTVGTLTATTDGEVVGTVVWQSVSTVPAFVTIAAIVVTQVGAAGGTFNASEIIFQTSDGIAATAEAMKVDKDGTLVFGSATLAGRIEFRDGIDTINDIAMFSDSNADFTFDNGPTIITRGGFTLEAGSGGWQFAAGIEPATQTVFPFEFKMNGVLLNTTHVDTFALQSLATDDCFIAYNTSAGEKFILGYRDDTSDNFLLNKTTTINAANQVMLYDPDGGVVGGSMTFGGDNKNVDNLIIQTNSTASEPRLTFFANEDTPTNEQIGTILFLSKNDAGSPEQIQYGIIQGIRKDKTDGSEDGRLRFRTITAGVIANVAEMAQGLIVDGGSTAIDKGAGTINVKVDIFKDGTVYDDPDYVLEHWVKGSIELFSENPGAKEYKGLMDLSAVKNHIQSNLRLPGISDEPMGMFKRGNVLLEKLEEIFIHLINHEEKIEEINKLLTR